MQNAFHTPSENNDFKTKPPQSGASKLRKAAYVRAHFGGVSDMSLWRWTKAGTLPEPLRINGQRYWTDEQLEETRKRLSGEIVEAA